MALRHQVLADGLAPVRVEVELDDRLYKDAFLWNVAESDAKLAVFVADALEESGFPPMFAAPAVEAAKAQVADFRALQAQLRGTSWPAAAGSSTTAAAAVGMGRGPARPSSVVEEEAEDREEDEELHLIRLEVRAGNTVLRDQFYWDVRNPNGDPDAFARQLCRDLDVQNPALAPAVSIALREQLVEIARYRLVAARERARLLSRKSNRRERAAAAAVGRGAGAFDDPYGGSLGRPGGGVTTSQLLATPTITRPLRVLRSDAEWSMFGPTVETLTDADVKMLELRELRRARMKRKMEEREEAAGFTRPHRRGFVESS